MKIFRFFIHNKSEETTLDNHIDVVTIPDTALLIQKRPFFIPDFTKQCMAQLCACVRINRLGRSIHERFAYRYYNANNLTLGLHFVARDLLDKLQAAHRPYDKALGFDNAVVIPEHAEIALNDNLTACICINQQAFKTQFDNKDLQKIIDKGIAHISEFYTMRQGDLLLFPLSINELKVNIDDQVSLYLNNSELIKFNIK